MSKRINPNAVYLGRAIACTRLEQGFKRKNLATAAGISYPLLAEIENGKEWPSFAMIDRIAAELGVNSLYLFSRAKCISEDYPLPCWIALQHDDHCTCWEVALQATDVSRGADRVS